MKKQNFTVKKAYIDLFNSTVFVSWGNPADISKYMKRNFPGAPAHLHDWLGDPGNHENCGVAISEPGNSSNVFIWLKDKPDPKDGYEVLVHEVIHATKSIMKHWSLFPIDNSNNEIQAMLGGHIMKKIFE